MSTKILVTSEVLSGVIDGINKTFSASKNIEGLVKCVVGGTVYSQITFVRGGNTVTLNDAPISGNVVLTYIYEGDYDYNDFTSFVTGEYAGTGDGVNTEFFVFNPISIIDSISVSIGTLPSYSFIGNRIKFATPIANGGVVLVDYFKKDAYFINEFADKYFTKEEVIRKVYDEIGQDETSQQYKISLVRQAIDDGINNIGAIFPDKSRNGIFPINSCGTINVTMGETNNTASIVAKSNIPNSGRLIGKLSGNVIDYSSINSSGSIVISSLYAIPSPMEEYYVGYKIPRSMKRISSIVIDGESVNITKSINDFLTTQGVALINNGYLYTKNEGIVIVEFELSESLSQDDDNSYVPVEKSEIAVIIYYALRRLYVSREDDRKVDVYKHYEEELKTFKRGMVNKRIRKGNQMMRTKNLLTK